MVKDYEIKYVNITKPYLEIAYFRNVRNAAHYFLSLKQRPLALVALNATKLVSLYQNQVQFSKLRNIQYYPDGAPICWFAPAIYNPIPGVELWLEIIRQSVNGTKILVIGADEKTNQIAINKLKRMYPNLEIQGLNGYLDYTTYETLIEKLQPDLVFCALGSPKQEHLMARLQRLCENALFMGLGGSLDVFVGKVDRAPLIFRKNKIEFLYRILRQPKRLIRQKPLIIFLWLYLTRAFGAKN